MYNLSKPQKLIYDMEKYAGGAVAVICGSMIVRGTKSLPELKTAVNELYRLNDAFRMHIVETSSGVRQVVNEFAPYDAEVLRFSSRDELDSYGASWAKKPMDLYGPLCEIKLVLLSDSYGLLVKLHHIIADAWTLSLLGTQFNAILSGEVPAAYSYTEYLAGKKPILKVIVVQRIERSS